MEKRTIGKFISALRRANGMTQRELADKLFVSDKTVSRWERDESTPEITLIPVIAELFGVTSDELIRGERVCNDRTENGETAERSNQRTEKSIRAILYERNKRHGNLMLLSLGISFLGIIAAMIANLAFSEGLIGFCLMLVFALSGEICGICFTRNVFISVDEEDFSCGSGEITAFNSRAVQSILRLTLFNICEIAFCIPIVAFTAGGANYGLAFGWWVAYGAIIVACVLAVLHVFYVLWLKGWFLSRRLLSESENEGSARVEIRGKLIRILVILLACEAVISGGMWFNYNFVYDIAVEKKVFDTCEEFKAYVEADVAEYRRESQNENARLRGETVTVGGVEVEIFEEEIGENYDFAEKGKIYDSAGNLICEYEYLPHLYRSVRFTESSHDKTPITVITYEASHNAKDVVDTVGAVLIVAVIASFVGMLVLYVTQLVSIRKKYGLS